MVRVCVLACLLCLSACADAAGPEGSGTSSPPAKMIDHFSQVAIGMSREEVHAHLNGRTCVDAGWGDILPGGVKVIYGTEIVKDAKTGKPIFRHIVRKIIR